MFDFFLIEIKLELLKKTLFDFKTHSFLLCIENINQTHSFLLCIENINQIIHQQNTIFVSSTDCYRMHGSNVFCFFQKKIINFKSALLLNESTYRYLIGPILKILLKSVKWYQSEASWSICLEHMTSGSYIILLNEWWTKSTVLRWPKVLPCGFNLEIWTSACLTSFLNDT